MQGRSKADEEQGNGYVKRRMDRGKNGKQAGIEEDSEGRMDGFIVYSI